MSHGAGGRHSAIACYGDWLEDLLKPALLAAVVSCPFYVAWVLLAKRFTWREKAFWLFSVTILNIAGMGLFYAVMLRRYPIGRRVDMHAGDTHQPASLLQPKILSRLKHLRLEPVPRVTAGIEFQHSWRIQADYGSTSVILSAPPRLGGTQFEDMTRAETRRRRE
jgi:hypothetical protein